MPKNLIILIAICITAITVNWILYQKPSGLRSQTIASDTMMTDFDGKTFALRDVPFQKDMVIHFWATWCPPCIAELPSLLNRAAEEETIPFLIVSVDRDVDIAKNFIQKYADVIKDKNNIYLLYDQHATITQNVFRINTFPETVILNPDFSVRKHIRGTVNWSNMQLKR